MSDDFDTPEETDVASAIPARPVKVIDPMRPEAVRGRYTLPNPVTGKSKSWQRATNLIKLCEDTYHLDLWKQRHVAHGLALMPGIVADVARMDVKGDKDRLNRIVEKALEASDAYAMATEGTALHTSTELFDYAAESGEAWPLLAVPEHHRDKVAMYSDAMVAAGIKVTPGMIERVVASSRYDAAGKFDRVVTLADGTHCVWDLKTSDNLDLSFPSISGQLALYEDGINHNGVWDGQRYDDSIKVRKDFALVMHLPSTRDEAVIYKVDLAKGRELLADCLRVRDRRKVKARDVATVFDPSAHQAAPPGDEEIIEWLNRADTVKELLIMKQYVDGQGLWNERLANVARGLARELS